MENNQDSIKSRLAILTPEYKEFLFGVYPSMTANTFGEGLNLGEDGTIVFENGLSLFLMAFIDQAGFEEFLRNECNVSAAVAHEVVETICDGLPQQMLYGLNNLYKTLNQSSPASTDTAVQMPTPTTASAFANNNADEARKRQQLAELSNRFTPVAKPSITTPTSATASAATSQPTPLVSAAERLDSVPVAKPVSSAQLTSLSTPVPERELQPNVAAAAQNVPPAWQSGGAEASIAPVRTMEDDAQRIHGYGAYREQYPNLYQDEEKAKETIRSVAQDSLLRPTRPIVDTPNFNDPQPPA